MSRENFSQTPDQTAQDELSRFVEEAIASYRQKVRAEEQYESPVPVFDEETGHYVYQMPSEEEDEGEQMQTLTEKEDEQTEESAEKDAFYYEPISASTQETAEWEETNEEKTAEEETAEEETADDEAKREQQLFMEANRPGEAVPSQIPNPLPVPQRRGHVALDYDLEEHHPSKEETDPEDDFDIEIDEDDDFDI